MLVLHVLHSKPILRVFTKYDILHEPVRGTQPKSAFCQFQTFQLVSVHWGERHTERHFQAAATVTFLVVFLELLVIWHENVNDHADYLVRWLEAHFAFQGLQFQFFDFERT